MAEMAEMADMAVFRDGRDGLFSFTNPILLRTQVPILGKAIWSECCAVFIELYQ